MQYQIISFDTDKHPARRSKHIEENKVQFKANVSYFVSTSFQPIHRIILSSHRAKNVQQQQQQIAHHLIPDSTLAPKIISKMFRV